MDQTIRTTASEPTIILPLLLLLFCCTVQYAAGIFRPHPYPYFCIGQHHCQNLQDHHLFAYPWSDEESQTTHECVTPIYRDSLIWVSLHSTGLDRPPPSYTIIIAITITITTTTIAITIMNTITVKAAPKPIANQHPNAPTYYLLPTLPISLPLPPPLLTYKPLRTNRKQETTQTSASTPHCKSDRLWMRDLL